ncbi:MAG: hypothetical protein II961_03160 [Candidatus Riflebacteria bacterium]|jgi:hypothetical protein|nr:hypothetical protein [Candidatus Riflebacteria bacterium]
MKERIKNAIEILTTNKGDGWFTVLEEPKSEKFIQFTYDESYGLQVDLPVVALQPEELAKAEKLMGEYSIEKIEINPAEDDCCCCSDEHEHGEDCDCNCCDGEEKCEEKFESFNKKVDDNNKAIEIAYRVFKEVYGLSDDTAINVTIFR